MKVTNEMIESINHPTLDIIMKRDEVDKITAFLRVYKKFYLLTKGITIVSIDGIEVHDLNEIYKNLNDLYESVKMTRIRKMKLNFLYMEKFRKEYTNWSNDILILYKLILKKYPIDISYCEDELDMAYTIHHYFNNLVPENKSRLFYLKSWDLESIDRWIRANFNVEEE